MVLGFSVKTVKIRFSLTFMSGILCHSNGNQCVLLKIEPPFQTLQLITPLKKCYGVEENHTKMVGKPTSHVPKYTKYPPFFSCKNDGSCSKPKYEKPSLRLCTYFSTFSQSGLRKVRGMVLGFSVTTVKIRFSTKKKKHTRTMQIIIIIIKIISIQFMPGGQASDIYAPRLP